jgi:hypothetical protein
MASVLQIVDDQDLTSVLFDLNSPTGTNNPNSLQTEILGNPDWGRPPAQSSRFEPPASDGGAVIKQRFGLTEAKIGVRFGRGATTTDGLRSGVERVARYLRSGCVMRWSDHGSTVTRYVDVEPSDLPVLHDGRELSIYKATVLFDTPEGVVLQFLRQPFFREAELDPAVNKWSNASMLADSDRNGTPDGWTLDGGTHTIQTTEAFQISHSGAVDLIHRDYTASAGTQISVGIDARKVSGDRTVEIRLISLASATVLATATVTGTAWARYTVTGTVAGGDTSVRISIRYTGGTNATVSQFRDSQLETGTLVASVFRTGAEFITNDPAGTNGRAMVISNPGDMPAPVKITGQAEAGSPRIGSVLIGLRASDGIEGHRTLTSYLNETRFAQCDTTGNGWTTSLGTNTTSVADAAGSGGNVAECTFTMDPTVMARRVRLTRTTLLDSLRSYHDVWVRLKPSAAMKLVVQLRWAPSLADPASYSEVEVTLDWSDATSFSYVDVPLGTIYVPEDTAQTLAGVGLEIWARRETGSGNCRFDVVSLFGSDPDHGDMLTVLEVPGGSRESWLGKDLVTPTNPAGLTAGAVINNRIRLNAATEAAGTPPVGGLAWPVGRHKLTFRIDGNGDMDFTALVRNITDSTDSVSRSFPSRKPSKVSQIVLKFDSVTAKSYQPQIKVTGAISAGEYLDVRRIIHEFQPYLGSSEQLRTDPEKALLMKLDSSANLISYLGAAGGVPLYAPPGRSVLEAIPIDIEVHSGATHGESVLARTLSISGRLAPRHSG